MKKSTPSGGVALEDEVSERSSNASLGSADTSHPEQGSEQDQEIEAIRKELAMRETQNVLRLRVVLQGLLVTAIVVSIAVYFVTSNAETDEFETQFKGSAVKVCEAFGNIASQRIGAISSLAVAAIAHGVDHHRDWPFVTLSSFQQRASTARDSSKALVVSIAPLVNESERNEWESSFVPGEDSYWIQEGFEYQSHIGIDVYDKSSNVTENPLDADTGIYREDTEGNDIRVAGYGPFLPFWQTSPLVRHHFTNQDVFSRPELSDHALASIENSSVQFGGILAAPVGGTADSRRDTSYFATLLSFHAHEDVTYQGDPMSYVFIPIFDSFSNSRQSVGVMIALINWGSYFQETLAPHIRGVRVVLTNPCYDTYTYAIEGSSVKPLGFGDLHDREYNYLRTTASFDDTDNIADGTKDGLPFYEGKCQYGIAVYPSRVFYNEYKTSTPIFVTLAVASVFFFIALLFVVYDRLVERRQKVVMNRAVQSSALVSSLFPKNVQERLLRANENDALMPQNHRLKNFLRNGDSVSFDQGEDGMNKQQPIADLFPSCTVLFADIAGFTAWSSARDPPQVFVLLQSLYQAFDKIAKNRKVFKVETIGDSYMAATGLPEKQDKHFIIMARFAHDCNMKMREIVHELEVVLGPDTAELQMRFGLHSGPVTAGVLLGDRARFQLFGDTVNTAARMESTGVKGKIQLSQSTAELIIGAGKEHWVVPREDEVNAKGKGSMKTYWLRVCSDQGSKSTGSSSNESVIALNAPVDSSITDKTGRMVDWMVELLSEHIKKVIARNQLCGDSKTKGVMAALPLGNTPLDEVSDKIKLPKFDAKTAKMASDCGSVELEAVVVEQLRNYVFTVACMYHANPFHCFEHACHVTQSVSKLLKRVVSPEISEEEVNRIRCSKSGALASTLHDYTYGINSDPLTSLAIVFSALIHDADHRGVSNVQLIKEQPELAQLYNRKSVAEQNSVDLSWDLFMSDQFQDLRACIFATKNDLQRFRQVIVNVVLATDIFDKELNDLRRLRWDRAFTENPAMQNQSDLKATIVIEYIMQASDVSHTMQHWHIYRKWNECLFREMYLAYKQERMGANPADFWYDGELAFLDNYIIPLSKRLKECGVFGVASDEHLTYAMANREEWEQRGKVIVAEMVSRLEANQEEVVVDVGPM